ncbi:MAG: hypothetical protein JNM09_27190 [Blastocatellia bacterium]|nr:hypothetical protein [Blastocatellia bacterium]
MMNRRQFLISTTTIAATTCFETTGNAQQMAVCDYSQSSSNGFNLDGGWLNPGPFRSTRIMNFAVDRKSFLDRGWTY